MAAAAAAAAAAPLKHSSWPWFFSRPTTTAIAAHFSSPIPTKPLIPFPFAHNHPRRCFSTSPLTTSTRPPPAADDDPLDDADLDPDESPGKKSRNELKREARRAVRWGMELANFSTPQIKRVVKVASLEAEVFEALMLVKKLGHDVREGKRRQFNYIGRLLRTAQPELMDALIQASKDGDSDRLLALPGQEMLSGEDEDAEEETDNEEDGGDYTEIAVRWFDGLIYKDPSVVSEVYAIHNVDFDRQVLRKLVRRVQAIQEGSPVEGTEEKNDAMWARAKKPLIRFLRSLAKKSLEE